MNDIEFLQAVRSLIDTPEKWTQRAFGRLTNGKAISAHKSDHGIDLEPLRDATSLCVVGAAYVAGGETAHVRLAELLGFQFAWLMAEWNDGDGRTHAEVMAQFDEAIARLQ